MSKPEFTDAKDDTWSIHDCDDDDDCVVLERSLFTSSDPHDEVHIPRASLYDLGRWMMEQSKEMP